jgi:hypothetical protein
MAAPARMALRLARLLKHADRRPGAVRPLGELAQELEHPHARRSRAPDGSQILQVKNFGKKSLQEIADLLEREGLNFGMRFEEAARACVCSIGARPPSRAAAAAPDDMEE